MGLTSVNCSQTIGYQLSANLSIMNLLSLLQSDPIFAFVFLLSIVLAITVHEFAHAWTAYKLGDDTPYLMGRVSLSPLAHLDPIGSICFVLAGFGWGKPVLYNPMRLQRRVDELWIALAGPFSNIALALILNLLAVFSIQYGGGILNPDFLRFASLINLTLAAFNIIPIPPLDGSSIIAYFFPGYRDMVAGQIGMLIVIGLVLFSVGNSSLLSFIITPIISAFSWVASLGGIL